MKVLAIGGTGVIGSRVVRELLGKEVEVTAVARSFPEKVFFQGSEVTVVLGNRKNVSFLQELSKKQYDCVIDLACYEPGDAGNAVAIFRGKTGHYIFVSTVDVYTKPAKVYPVSEDAERCPRPSFPYAWKKHQCEEIFLFAYSRGFFPLTIIRPAHTYAEGATPLLQVFGWGTYHLDRIKKGKPVIIHGDGNSLWSSCHAEDVARGIVGAVLKGEAFGKAYNLASEEFMTWNQLYRIVAEAMGAPPPHLVHIPAEILGKAFPQKALWCVENFQYSNVFCVDLAKRDLGFATRIPYRKGVARCLEWFEKNGGFESCEAPQYAFYDRFLEEWKGRTASWPKLED